MVTVWLALAAGATGPDLAGPQPWVVDWSRRDRESTNVARVGGVIAGLAPLVLTGAALAPDSDAPGSRVALTVGAAGMVTGPTMLAGGGMRARRSLREQGVEAPRTAGIVGWTLLGGAAAALVAIPRLDDPTGPAAQGLGYAFVGTYVGASIAGQVQLGVNRRHRQRAGRSRDVERRPIPEP